MSDATQYRLTHLSLAANRLGSALARPKALAWACVIALAGLGWLALAVLCAGGALDVLCGPAAGALNATSLALVAAMWCAMTLAMMLPSAGPMILTYAEIAETAARKGECIVSPLVLAAGYAAVWLGFAAVAAVVQVISASAGVLTSGLFAGALFVGAGLYQFSTLKHACLTQCQRPFPFFFTNWQTTTRGVFRLGVQQGVYCLGCCWAMMLLMFASGAMNVVWMAALGVVLTIEKMTATAKFSRATGVVLIAIGAAFVTSGVLR